MRVSESHLYRIIVCGVIFFVVNSVHAAPQGPAYPPPNGVTFVGSGDSGRAGGRNFAFTNVNLTGLTQLYWGPIPSIELTLNSNATDYLTAASHTTTTAQWTGSSTIYLGSGPAVYQTRFTIVLTGAAQFVTVGSVGITNGESVVANVTGNFTANLLFEIDPDGPGGAAPGPVLDVYDSLQTVPPSTSHTSVSAGFWWNAVLLGDMNCDGVVNLNDVGPFVLALINPSSYTAQFPACNINLANMNGDAAIDGRDIQGFVTAILGI